MAQKHNVSCIEHPMTVATTEQGPQKRYRRLRFPSFNSDVWSEKNPLLQKGELGHEKDTGRFKVGDGVTYWEDLPYNSVGDKGDKGDNAIINGYNTINIVEGRNISVEQEGDTLIISAKGEASGSYNKEEIDNKFAVVNSSIDANADAIQKTRDDYIEADSEIHQILNSHAGELTTLKNNQASLGDQVSGIEEKIPENASAQNQLATQNDITNKITNCITEIPQDIKLELKEIDGVNNLILKAGSKVYVPNGAGVFDVITIKNDMSSPFSTNGTHLVGFAPGFSSLATYINAVSGTTEPTTLSNGLAWYDTTNNVIKRAWGGSWQASLFSLPVAVVTVSNGAISSIDQVFNGFGYIGSTVFVLPGVKGLIPNGRNADGTLKNIVAQSTSVRTLTRNSGSAGTKTICLSSSGAPDLPGGMEYNEKENQNYNFGSKSALGIFGSLDLDSNYRISNFNIKQAFHAVDYNDFEELDNSVVHKTGDETIGGTKTFTGSHLQIKNSAGTGGTGVKLTDSGGKGSSELVHYYVSSEQRYYTRLVCRNTAANKYAYVELTMTDGGEVRFGNSNLTYMNAPTPAASSNSTDVATTAWVNNAAVHKTGNETVNGVKTFTGYIKASAGVGVQINATSHSFNLRSYGATPEGCGLFVDNDTGKTAFNVTDTKITIGSNAVAPHSLTPASSSNGTNIATTAFVKSVLSSSGNGLATFSKAQNGYYKFTNGLIIQWGHIAAETASTNGSVTFPTPFTTANAVVSINHTGVNNAKLVRPVDITTTGFKYQNDTFGSANPSVGKVWIAIGY